MPWANRHFLKQTVRDGPRKIQTSNHIPDSARDAFILAMADDDDDDDIDGETDTAPFLCDA